MRRTAAQTALHLDRNADSEARSCYNGLRKAGQTVARPVLPA